MQREITRLAPHVQIFISRFLRQAAGCLLKANQSYTLLYIKNERQKGAADVCRDTGPKTSKDMQRTCTAHARLHVTWTWGVMDKKISLEDHSLRLAGRPQLFGWGAQRKGVVVVEGKGPISLELSRFRQVTGFL